MITTKKLQRPDKATARRDAVCIYLLQVQEGCTAHCKCEGGSISGRFISMLDSTQIFFFYNYSRPRQLFYANVTVWQHWKLGTCSA